MIETAYYRIRPYSNLLHVNTFLSWDEKVVNTILDDIKTVVTNFYRDKQWGLLSDRTAWELGTPGAERLFSETAPIALNDTLTHVAIVIGESEIKRWQLETMTEKYHRYTTRFFKTTEEAESWLASFGYKKETPVFSDSTQ